MLLFPNSVRHFLDFFHIATVRIKPVDSLSQLLPNVYLSD